MKKSLLLGVVGWLILSVSLPAKGVESGVGMSLGLNVGGFPFFYGTNSLNYGGELGIQFLQRIAFRAEISFATVTSSYENEYVGTYFSSSYTDKTTYSAVPISGTLLYKAPINPYLSANVGAGFGYYPISIKEEWTEEYTSSYGLYSDSDSDSETENFDGFAPHFSAGLELFLSGHFVVFGDIRHIVGKTKYEDRDGGSFYSSDVHFGGTSVRIGIRFYSNTQK